MGPQHSARRVLGTGLAVVVPLVLSMAGVAFIGAPRHAPAARRVEMAGYSAVGPAVLRGPGHSRIQLWNPDPAIPVRVNPSYFDIPTYQVKSHPAFQIPPGAGVNLDAEEVLGDLNPGPDVGRLDADHLLGAGVTTLWAQSGGIATYPGIAPARALAIPLVTKDLGGQSSIVTILNLDLEFDPEQAPTAHVVLFDDQGVARVDTTVVLTQTIYATLDLGKHPLFARIPADFKGWMLVTADVPLAALAVLDWPGRVGVYALPGVPLAEAGRESYVPLYLLKGSASPGAGAIETTIYVTNLGAATIQPQETFRGSGGTCAGMDLDWTSHFDPPKSHGMAVLRPDSQLGDDCQGTVVIHSTDADVLATVVYTQSEEGRIAAYSAVAAPSVRVYLPLVAAQVEIGSSGPGRADSAVAGEVRHTGARRLAGPGAAPPAGTTARGQCTASTGGVGGRRLVVPVIRNGDEGLGTTIQVMNLGQATTEVTLTLVDARGNQLGECGDACRATVLPLRGHAWRLPDLASFPVGSRGSAILAADQPLTAVALDLPSGSGDIDASTALAEPELSPTACTPRWLPLLLNHCRADESYDVVMVIDASTSMLEPTSMGVTRLALVRGAVWNLFDWMGLESDDQGAIIAFHSVATLLQPLTNNLDALDGALSRIQVAAGSRLDLGLLTAQMELAGARHAPHRRPVIIAFTDGRVSPVPAELAIAAAATAKASGTTIFTVGLGSDYDADILRQMATRPDLFFGEPESEYPDYVPIDQIWRALRCR